ncbi:MAG: hypothetical protein AAFY72_13290 [Cyanobacteria bacterium J06649_4]
MTFSDVVEAVKKLSTDEKHEVQKLLEQYLREERPNEIHNKYLEAKAEEEQGNLKFSSNIEELKQQLQGDYP